MLPVLHMTLCKTRVVGSIIWSRNMVHRVQHQAGLLAGSLNSSLEVMRQNPEVFSSIDTINFSGMFTAASELPADLGSLFPDLTTFYCSACKLTGTIPAGMPSASACCRMLTHHCTAHELALTSEPGICSILPFCSGRLVLACLHDSISSTSSISGGSGSLCAS